MLLRRRPQRALALLAAPALALTLTACGGSPSEDTEKGFDAVSISGDVGSTPTFDWKGMLEPQKAETKVVTEGDGTTLQKGDGVLVNIAISNDYTQNVNYDTFGADEAGVEITVGQSAQPQKAIDLVAQLVADQIEAGKTKIGTRIEGVASVDQEWPDYATNLVDIGVGNKDGIAFVADLESTVRSGPTPKPVHPAAWAPTLEKDDKGVPFGLDSSGLPKPDLKAKDVKVTTLLRGNGPKVAKGDITVVNYLGQTWGGEEAFDESYSKGQTLAVNIAPATKGGGTTVIKGWSDALVGVPVGSRIIVEVPPAEGYGSKGQPPTINGDDILYFVIDVLGTA
ncbi:FKBP-type peptidyl-prolyl cis-trans isomerase [Nocardioides panacisoli]|uniref:peptidylprolyl isomerase n=1 Tax=Nocardioides panacisoli TaxID=627624 RepID=A0ABP7IPJ9_9ACTN